MYNKRKKHESFLVICSIILPSIYSKLAKIPLKNDEFMRQRDECIRQILSYTFITLSHKLVIFFSSIKRQSPRSNRSQHTGNQQGQAEGERELKSINSIYIILYCDLFF